MGLEHIDCLFCCQIIHSNQTILTCSYQLLSRLITRLKQANTSFSLERLLKLGKFFFTWWSHIVNAYRSIQVTTNQIMVLTCNSSQLRLRFSFGFHYGLRGVCCQKMELTHAVGHTVSISTSQINDRLEGVHVRMTRQNTLALFPRFSV
jgi:hypothetical protein